MGLTAAPRTWTTSEVVTAAMLNAEVRDAVTGLEAAWTSYTPAWTAATTNPTIGNGTIVGAYMQVGKTVHFRLVVTAGSTTTFGSGAYSLTIPVAPLNSGRQGVYGHYSDSSPVADYPAELLIVGGSATCAMRVLPGTAGLGWTAAGPATPITMASGDSITFSGTYEAA